MIIGSQKKLKQINSDPSINLGDCVIRRVKITKSLGLMIDETLIWDELVNLITKKVNKCLSVLKQLRVYVGVKILLLVYKTLV